jgi:hypothetical protein
MLDKFGFVIFFSEVGIRSVIAKYWTPTFQFADFQREKVNARSIDFPVRLFSPTAKANKQNKQN